MEGVLPAGSLIQIDEVRPAEAAEDLQYARVVQY
jgi:hypothetical protein